MSDHPADADAEIAELRADVADLRSKLTDLCIAHMQICNVTHALLSLAPGINKLQVYKNYGEIQADIDGAFETASDLAKNLIDGTLRHDR